MQEEIFKTRYHEMNPKGQIPVWVLQNYFQEAAGIDAHNLSYGWEELSINGVAWILTKLQMQILKPIVGGSQKIKVKTWHCYSDKIQSRRDFVMFNEAGEHIAKGVSWWLIMDLNKRKITRSPQSLIDLNDKNPAPIMEPSMEKPPRETELGELLNTVKLTARLEDLDSNNHVNNSHFSAWALESLSAERTEGKTLAEIIIYFKAEVRHGDEVLSNLYPAGQDCYWHILKRPLDDKEIAAVYTKWE